MATNEPSRVYAYFLPLLFCIIAGAVHVPGWDMWGEQPLQQVPGFAKFLGGVLMPFGVAGFFLMFATMPVVLFLQAIPGIGELVSGQFPFLLFTAYLLLRYRKAGAGRLWRASLVGTLVIYAVSLFILLDMKGSTDGQAGIAIAIGLNAAFLMALVVTEIMNLPRAGIRRFLKDNSDRPAR